jgi:hypothetical protein
LVTTLECIQENNIKLDCERTNAMENLLRKIEIQQGEGHDYLKKCTNYTYESRCFDASHFWLH